MPLLELTHFEKLFSPFKDKRVVFVPLSGNVGDYLNHMSTMLMFKYFGIESDKIDPGALSPSIAGDYDELVISGGGNMGGDFYQSPYQSRQEIIGYDIPITVFPQSFIQNREDLSPYKKIYVREKASRKLNPGLELAPDLALGYIGEIPGVSPEFPTGVFLRCDVEQKFMDDPLSLGDPAWLSRTVEELFDLACRFEHIVTDRLHFGITALLAGRKVTLLPNSYFKNRSFYETWLRGLCEWRDDLSGIDYDRERVEYDLCHRLAGAPSVILDWDALPISKNGYFLEEKEGKNLLIHVDGEGSGSLECSDSALMVWQLCDGSRTAGEIVQLLVGAFPGNSITIARDVQSILGNFSARGSIDIEPKKKPLATSKQVQGRRGKRKVATLVVCDPEVRKRRVRYSALLNGVELWFEVAAKHKCQVSTAADPFLLVSLMHAMRARTALKVEGAPVTSGLLENLEEFQRAWARWRKQLVPVAVEASVAPAVHRQRNPAIATFSGGVDSSYTVYRHLVDPDRKWLPELEAVMMIQGFDSDLQNDEKFKHSCRNGRKMLLGLPVELITVQTNIKHHLGNWLDRHGLLLGAALSLFSARFGTGIIANTSPYEMLLPLGSNPLTDPLMGSDGFKIVHHGGEVSRFEKILAMIDWPPLQDHLRVCWRNDTQGRLNCGKCLSCVLAALSFRCLGKSPDCLPFPDDHDVLAQALAMRLHGRVDWYDMKCVVQEAEKRGLGDAEWLLPVKEQLAALQ